MFLMQITPTHLEVQGFWFGTQEDRDWELVKDCLSLRRASLLEMEMEKEGGRKEREKRRRKKKRRKGKERTAAIAEPEKLGSRIEMDRCSESLRFSEAFFWFAFFRFVGFGYPEEGVTCLFVCVCGMVWFGERGLW